MMHLTHSFRNLVTREFSALELPYENNSISMVILMPDGKVGLAKFEKTLTKERMKNILGAMSSEDGEIQVVLPKFKFEFKKELSKDFRALGANKIFEEGLYSDYCYHCYCIFMYCDSISSVETFDHRKMWYHGIIDNYFNIDLKFWWVNSIVHYIIDRCNI